MTNRISRTNKYVSRSWSPKRVSIFKKLTKQEKIERRKNKIKRMTIRRFKVDSNKIKNIIKGNPNYCLQSVTKYSINSEGDKELVQELENQINKLGIDTQTKLILWCQKNKYRYHLVDILKD